MELLKKFRDTIFLKSDSDLEKQINELKNIRNNLSNTEEIDKDIKLLEYGINGEKEIEFELKNANIGMYVLHDVTYEYNGNKAQIDYLIFSRGHFYLVECKNLYGNITVDNTGQFYREFEYNGKKIKESIYSPYTQAIRHLDMLKKVWKSNHSKMDNFLLGNLIDKDFFIPLVVLANSKSFLNIRYAPKEIKKHIIRADQLISYIQNDINKIKNSSILKEKTLKNAAEVWLSRSVTNNINLADKYTKNLDSQRNKNNLENELRLFRKERSKELNIPAYYVFTDEEMVNIINLMPNTMEKLKESKILSSIKIKCHGEKIIEIINNSSDNKYY